MALIAGYVTQRPQPTEEVSRRVRSFQILPRERPDDYRQEVVSTRHGHLVVKYRTTHAIPPRIASDAQGNALAMLGFVLPDARPEALLTSAVRTAARSVEECEGQFVIAFADARSGEIHLSNDRFSSRPCYVARTPHGVYFSSNLAFLLMLSGQRYRADVAGWLQVCAVGHTVGTRTTAEGVTRLAPGSHVTVSNGHVKEQRYWRLEHRPDPSLDPAGHSDEVFEAFRTSVDGCARLAPKAVVGLSGGLDSRLLAGALPRDVECDAFTFLERTAPNHEREVQVATDVAAALVIRHHVETLPTGYAQPAEVLSLTGGMRPYQHMAYVMAYVQELRRLNRNFFLGGGPGDSLAGAFVPSRAYVDPTRLNECMSDALERRLTDLQSSSLFLRQDVIDASRAAAEREITESLAELSGPTAAHRITAWAMTIRQPAFTFTSVFHTHPDMTEAFGHLGYRYADLMLALPASWLYGKTFYGYMIFRSLPQLRDIPYANTGAILSGVPPAPGLPPESLARRRLSRLYRRGRRACGRLVRSIIPVHGSRPSLVFRDSALLDSVRECIHSIAGVREIVDVRRSENLLARTRNGACPSDEALGVLTALAVSASTLPRGMASAEC